MLVPVCWEWITGLAPGASTGRVAIYTQGASTGWVAVKLAEMSPVAWIGLGLVISTSEGWVPRRLVPRVLQMSLPGS